MSSKDKTEIYVIGSSTALSRAIDEETDDAVFFGRTNPNKFTSWIEIPGLGTNSEIEESLKRFEGSLNPGKAMSLVCLQGISSDDWGESINVNLLSVARFIDVFCNYVKSNRLKGNVTMVGSASSYLGGKPAYSSTKAALFGLMNSINTSFAPSIRTNIVLPGVFEGGMIHDWSAKKRKKVSEQTYVKRIASASEITDAIMFCIRNEYVAGSVINMTSGQVIFA
jgi:NAD(P)-dependent dehydrogenase (short-subunit alcohol dehydrogenase family)